MGSKVENLAATQNAARGAFTVQPTELWEPGEKEVRIKVRPTPSLSREAATVFPPN